MTGENPMMTNREKISILVPTKGRPEMFEWMLTSALSTADYPDEIEFIISINARNEGYKESYRNSIISYNDDNKVLSARVDWRQATGNIFVGCDDDIVFRTKGWDTKAREAFDKYPDKIVLVYGDDGNPEFGKTTNIAFPMLYRTWVELIGRFYPPYFSSDFSDTWVTYIATKLNRTHHIDILMEHMHWGFGKRPKDDTDIERWEDHWRDNMPQKYLDTQSERDEELKKLQEYIDSFSL